MERGSDLPGALPGAADTIVALATPPGRGALAVLRLSGRRAHAIARAVVETWPAAPRRATLAAIHGASGEVLDRGIVVRYDAPRSFTGEDLVEISTHGGLVVSTTVMAALVELGARPAERGEFTRRALLNGKLDILQAEAVGDLISATSRAAQRTALQQLAGGLSRRVLSLRASVLEVEALIAYDIDFPEEDDGPVPPARTLSALAALEDALRALLRTAPAGELAREGALTVLAGEPNVGKSSLFNALLGRQRAIVTEVPGTTRDALEAVIEAEPWALRLVDTAGLRPTTDRVERLGIEVSEDYLTRAALVLVCGDSVRALRHTTNVVRDVLRAATAAPPLVLVRTKADLGSEDPTALASLARQLGACASSAVSAETGEGIRDLLAELGRVLKDTVGAPELDAPVLTHARHRGAVSRALDEVVSFGRAWCDEQLPATVAAVHLRAAAGALEDLVGAIDIEDVLDQLFRNFCVGK
ncbi:MAG TPA: tRNA uridine-5-carboxymethylaminomethyl(34) synthesis GTPase MnmE [Gemmatimonadaceae bacterium]|nr:tRNA uridine-5-carboxymethylaminomethyl(34) synthesis GTPase MnmE [Gemmatimonadaceae bacterium]